MKSVEILLVEDNEGDILLTREALDEGKINNTVHVVRNGRDAIEYLFQEGEFKDAVTPDLILLDINLPLKSGHEVLQVIKQDERTRKIPVIMLTTSSTEKDVHLSYKEHANCYITKPVDVDEFVKAVSSIESFWFNLVRLPVKS